MTTPKIQTIIENFVAELTAALSEASHNAIAEALGGGGQPDPLRSVRGKRGQSVRRAKGGKRSPEDLARTTQSLLAYIRKNPGKRVEEIGKALTLKTKELALPVKKLLADKAISKKGHKRSTAYYPKG